MQQFILSNRPVSQIIKTKQRGVLVLGMCKKFDLVGAYRHPDKNSDDISAFGVNLKEGVAVLVCIMLATIHGAC